MALCSQMINLIWFDIIDNIRDLLRVGKISIVKKKSGSGFMRIHIYMVDTKSIKSTGSPYDAMNLISPGKEELCQVRAILSGDASNERFFHLITPLFFLSTGFIILVLLPILSALSTKIF